MTKKLLLILAISLTILSCKKGSKYSGNTAFTTERGKYYLTEPIQFNNTSSGLNTFNWDFGDGSTSTDKSPKHAYKNSGNYTVKLSATGGATVTKTIKIYNGKASYQLQNDVSDDVHMVSFSVDAGKNLIDFNDHGFINANGGLSDTVFTVDSLIYLGGYLPSNNKTFIAVTPVEMTPFSNNILALENTTAIYVQNNIKKPQDINQLFHSKANAIKGNASVLIKGN